MLAPQMSAENLKVTQHGLPSFDHGRRPDSCALRYGFTNQNISIFLKVFHRWLSMGSLLMKDMRVRHKKQGT
jgi:hypothetical protein